MNLVWSDLDEQHRVTYPPSQDGAEQTAYYSTEKNHIPSDLVVDRWSADSEGSSRLDLRFLHDVWSYNPSQNSLSNINGLKIYH
jgi:hypothetical protein